MHELERRKFILKTLTDHGSSSLRSLATLLDASHATVRRDLTRLESEGLVRRVHGGVEAIGGARANALKGQDSFRASLEVNLAQKRSIAEEAAELVETGECIIVAGGTTTFALVQSLGDRALLVLTNSFHNAEYLHKNTGNRVILPGGELFEEQGVILSPFEQDVFQNYYASKLFISAQAVSAQGLMQTDPTLARSERRLLDQAAEIIAVVDSSKFSARGSLISCPIDRVHRVITDSKISPSVLEMLNAANVKVTIAKRYAYSAADTNTELSA
ncbi:MAG: DeoR/GlpR family DNA-binding transcription regulator [Polyangiaceae bacterium]|nr:DeoR/GlpR family DNA-binding transcription regulator [Polyangiaceae bacterium]